MKKRSKGIASYSCVWIKNHRKCFGCKRQEPAYNLCKHFDFIMCTQEFEITTMFDTPKEPEEKACLPLPSKRRGLFKG